MVVKALGCCLLSGFIFIGGYAQVDTAYIYNNSTPYGSLDIRIAQSATWYYYLQENRTFSFRESAPGVKTNTFFDMTAWDSSPYMEGNLREKNGSNDSFVMNYRLLLPQSYNASYEPGYPLILILHGSGERGNCWDNNCYHATRDYSPLTNTPPAPTGATSKLLNNDHQLSAYGALHLKARNDAGTMLPDDPALPARAFPGFILSPQNLNGWDINSTQHAIRLVRLICKKYNIDENRIYIHGYSNGGHGVFEALKRAPWMFAAALTMSAIDDAFVNDQKMAPAIARVPLWMFQGGLDTGPYPQKTENFIKQFRNAGAVVRYTRYANLGHGTWSTAYREPDFFTWILQKNNTNLHVFAGTPAICGSDLQLELPPGFKAYQWQLNGQTIPDATGALYKAMTPGVYRARYSRVENPAEEQWNRWSDPVEVKTGQPLPQARINQIGTVLLKDINGYGDARLVAAGDFAHYYWYKDGALIDFTGDQDDTVKNPLIKPVMGKGVYTLVTSNFDNCSSPASEGKYIFFNDEAPVNITPPANFAGTHAATSEITLSWTDASPNENGFEIWRRKKMEGSNFGPWQMAALLPASTTTFKDTGLNPVSTYQYKIRAVSSSGRSGYVPDASALEISTVLDTQVPATPQNLAATSVGVQKVKLSWRRSTDNTGIKEYTVYAGADSIVTGSADTLLYLSNLPLNAVISFTVRAKDLAGNFSARSNTAQASTLSSGLYYEHSTGSILDLDSIQWDKPEFTGTVQTFTLSPKTQDDYFNFRFDGYMYILAGGVYQFRIGSDDGSRLRIDGKVVVNNDGVHTFKTISSANQTLSKGPHRIMADFFDYIETDSLRVEYKGPDTNNAWALVGKDVLRSTEAPITALDPDMKNGFSLSIFPNPSSRDNIQIEIQSGDTSPVQVEMIDGIGRTLYSRLLEGDEVNGHFRIPVDEIMQPGIYIIRAKQGKVMSSQRLLITD